MKKTYLAITILGMLVGGMPVFAQEQIISCPSDITALKDGQKITDAGRTWQAKVNSSNPNPANEYKVTVLQPHLIQYSANFTISKLVCDTGYSRIFGNERYTANLSLDFQGYCKIVSGPQGKKVFACNGSLRDGAT